MKPVFIITHNQQNGEGWYGNEVMNRAPKNSNLICRHIRPCSLSFGTGRVLLTEGSSNTRKMWVSRSTITSIPYFISAVRSNSNGPDYWAEECCLSTIMWYRTRWFSWRCASCQFWLECRQPFSPNLTPSDFALFVVLKNALFGKWFQLHVEVEKFVKSFLINLDADIHYQALWNLAWCYTSKCLNQLGNYVKK